MSKMSRQEVSSALHCQRGELEKEMSDRMLAVLSELRLEKTLCDVVIKVGDTEFNAHKIILCSCSSYFRALFTGAWATSKKQMYTIPGVSPEMMHVIINYAYSHSVPVTEDNVVNVLAAADQFLVTGIAQACCVFLENQLCLKNCISIWRLVDFYYCPELRHKVFLYILDHFEEIVSVSQELLDVSEQQLAAIFESDHLNVKRESTVFEVLLRWIDHLPEQRQAHISMLLSKVRLGLMTVDYLTNSVMNNAVIKNSIESIPIINDAVTALLDFHAGVHPKCAYNNLLNRPRLPSAILLAIGGKGGSSAATTLEAYDARADCWVVVGAPIARLLYGAAVLDGFVYVIGSFSHLSHLNTVQRFDPVTSRWHYMAPMTFTGGYVCVAALNGCIYAMGGFDGQSYFKGVECYEPKSNRWTMRASMHVTRGAASAASLREKVYVCGGFNETGSLSTAEFYNPVTNMWTMISNMRCCRRGLGVVAYKDRIYAVGGTINETTCLRSVEAYNPRTNRWTNVPSMHNPRSYFGIQVMEEQLFVVGGYNGCSTMSAVERYDEEAGMWYSASNIKVSRRGLSVCVLHGAHSLVENLFPRSSPMHPNVEVDAGGSI